MIAGLALSLVAVGLFWSRKDDFTDIGSDTTVNQRTATMQAGALMFLDRPLLGVGPGCSLVAYPLYVPKEAHCGCEEQLVIHNAPVQVLSEMGILGFIPFTVIIGVSLLQAWRLQRSNAPRPLSTYAAGLELGLWGFIVCGLSGGFSYTWFPYLIVPLIVAARRITENNEQHPDVIEAR
jgi:O-antigen ligase